MYPCGVSSSCHFTFTCSVPFKRKYKEKQCIFRFVQVRASACNAYSHHTDPPSPPSPCRARAVIEALLRQPFNHALIQKYRNGRDNIGEHADKTLDILKGKYLRWEM